VIKLALICDSCGSIIAWGNGANEVRFKAQALYRTHQHKDLCRTCAVYVPPPPLAPQAASGHALPDTQTRADRVEP
jgi:hypothetical protein